MDTTPLPPIDLTALVDRINQMSANVPNPHNKHLGLGDLAQSVRHLHATGHTDVELVAVLCTTQPAYDEESGTFWFESSAFALRQGQTLVGLCGAVSMDSLTATAHAYIKEEMGIREQPISTRVVCGDDAMRLAPLITRRSQAQINAMVDSLCLSQAVAVPTLGRPNARM